MARSLPSAAREEAAASRDPHRRDDGGARRRRREATGRASEDLRGQLSNGLARIVVPVSLRQVIVRATERWRSRHYGPVHGHCRRRGCGGDPRRRSCREHTAALSTNTVGTVAVTQQGIQGAASRQTIDETPRESHRGALGHHRTRGAFREVPLKAFRLGGSGAAQPLLSLTATVRGRILSEWKNACFRSA